MPSVETEFLFEACVKLQKPLRLLFSRLASPLGEILLVHDSEGNLRALDFDDYRPRMDRLLRLHYGAVMLTAAPAPIGIAGRLMRYFAGDADGLTGIPLLTGGTRFQREVWAALRDIPPGTTLTYADLADRIGRPAACRAVGGANGANPIAIVIPCHRVIGHSAALTGFGGGLNRKAWLLSHEGAHYTN